MHIARVAASLLLSTAVLAGCGGDDSVATAKVKLDPKGFAQASTTLAVPGAAGVAPGSVAPDGANAPVDTDTVPADDGGALCRALDVWNEQMDSSMGRDPLASEASKILTSGANAFDSVILPVVPAAIRSGAEEFRDEMVAAANELAGVPDPEAHLGELYDAGRIPAFEAFGTSSKVASSIGSDGEAEAAAVYESAFVAWMADPCGPKSLAMDDAQLEFHEITTNI